MDGKQKVQSEHSILLHLPWQQHNISKDQSVILGKFKGLHCCISTSLWKGAIDSVVKIDCNINFIVPYSRNILS